MYFLRFLDDSTSHLNHNALPQWSYGNFSTDTLTPEKVAISGNEQMGALLVGLDKILYLIDRCRIYEILYVRRPQPTDPAETIVFKTFTSALVELYAIILKFLAKANKFLEKGTAQRGLAAFFNPTDVADLEKKCDSSEERVEREAGNCERYCTRLAQTDETKKLTKLLHDLESQNSLLVDVKGTVEAIWNQTTKDERIKILYWTSNIEFHKIHVTACEGRTPDTGDWILKHKEFDKWSSADESMILWLHGIRKSSLLSNARDKTY
jgi:hypothetical protein